MQKFEVVARNAPDTSSRSLYARLIQVGFFLSLLLIATGLTLSRSAISIGLVGVLSCGLLHLRWPILFSSVRRSPMLWLPLLWFAMLLVSYIYTEDIEAWYFLLRVSLPYLFVPLGIAAAYASLTETRKLWLYAAFIGGVAIVTLLTLYQYLENPAYYHARLLQSKEIPIVNGINHLSFGLMHAWAAHLCYTLWLALKQRCHLRLPAVAAVTGILLIICLHWFASRTGLVAFYTATLLRVGVYGWQQPAVRLRVAASTLIVLLAVCLVSVTIPTLRSKLQNSITDLDYFAAGARLDDWSLGRRLAAWQTAWHVGMHNPIVGVGPADVWGAMQRQYESEPFRFDDIRLRAATHNQFLESWAGLGIVGLVVFLALLFAPLRDKRVRSDGLAWAFCGILITGCVTDSMLYAQIGPNFHLLFAYLVMYRIPTTSLTVNK